MREKRRLERFQLNIPVTVTVESDGTPVESLSAESRDVSAKSVFLFIGKEQLDIGTPVKLEMFLTIERLREILDMSEQVKIEVSGEVTRLNTEGAVVCFNKGLKISPHQKD